MEVRVVSFGFKHGLPMEAALLFPAPDRPEIMINSIALLSSFPAVRSAP